MGIYTKIINEELNSTKGTMILTEESIYRSDRDQGKVDKYTISIHMDGDTDRNKGFYLDPYIKVCNANSWKGADRSIRFSMKTGKIISSHNDGKKPMKYTKDLGELLNDIMDSKTTCSKYNGMTVYDAFYASVKDRFLDKNIIKYPKPDFTINS